MSTEDVEKRFKEAAALFNQGKLQASYDILEPLLNAHANHPDLLHLLAGLHERSGRPAKAASILESILQTSPDHLPSGLSLGRYLRMSGQHAAAQQVFAHFTKKYPQDHRPAHGYAYSTYMLGDLLAAKQGFETVLQARPDHVGANYLLGSVLLDSGQPGEAIQYLEKAQGLKPDHADTFFKLVKARLDICDWSKRETDKEQLIQAIESLGDKPRSVPMYPLNYFDIPLELHLKAAQANARFIENKVKAFSLQEREAESKGGKPKIGYLSPDLRQHAVGMLIHEVFQHHDRHRFEVFAYGLLKADDYFNQSIRSGVDHYVELHGLSHVEAAQRIKNDGIDILIDLAGHSKFAAPEILALRPAPIQAQYLGYSDTMGADFVDYVIGDRTILPEEVVDHYTEKPVWLRYNFCASELPTSNDVFDKKRAGLPADAVVLGCTNAAYKFDPTLFDAWARIMERAPKTVLWLRACNDLAVQNMRAEMSRRGIGEERLFFMDELEFPEYMKRLELMDLYLDTFVYNAGSSGICAVKAGVPLLTLQGTTNASRMGASICQALGMEDLVCSTIDEYVDRAVQMATDLETLEQLKVRVKQAVLSRPAFNPKHFAGYLDEAYNKMWEVREKGNDPVGFEILD